MVQPSPSSLLLPPLLSVQIVQTDFATTRALVAIVPLESAQQTALLIWISEEGEATLHSVSFRNRLLTNLERILQYARVLFVNLWWRLRACLRLRPNVDLKWKVWARH